MTQTQHKGLNFVCVKYTVPAVICALRQHTPCCKHPSPNWAWGSILPLLSVLCLLLKTGSQGPQSWPADPSRQGEKEWHFADHRHAAATHTTFLLLGAVSHCCTTELGFMRGSSLLTECLLYRVTGAPEETTASLTLPPGNAGTKVHGGQRAGGCRRARCPTHPSAGG